MGDPFTPPVAVYDKNVVQTVFHLMNVWPEVFLWANNQGNKKNWAFKVRNFFISNQAPHLANVEQLHLAVMVIHNLDSILWEAKKLSGSLQ